MPASRSRTHRWRDCLWQVYERGGALEISIDRQSASGPGGQDLIWRVRILELAEDRIVVEQPAAFGRRFCIGPRAGVIGAMSIGQNRWMFRTVTGDQPTQDRLVLKMPEVVERCQRRSHYRVSGAAVELPSVECWPLLDPASVVAAEVANEALVGEMGRRARGGDASGPLPEQLLPDVGPGFSASLVNISGGGVGLLVPPGESSGVERARHLWLRIDLTPTVAAPVAMTGRVVHTHIDSTQSVHVGVAFEFGFNPAHQDFVVAQIGQLVERLQRVQERSRAA